MSFIPRPQEIYKHFKGNLYQVTSVAEHTETGELLVIYQALYGDFSTYARPLAMFTDRVDREKYPDVRQEFRFELQGPEAERQKEESEPATGVTAAGTAVSRAQGIRPQDISSQQTASRTEQEAMAQKDAERQDTQQVQSDMQQESEGSKVRFSWAADEPTAEELSLDPLVLEFLDADSYEQRLNILAGLHHRITDDMITTMAIACDVEVSDGDVEERYEALKNCLLTLNRYECNRLR